MASDVCSQSPLLVSIVGQDSAADAVRASLHAAGLQSHALMAKQDVATASCLTLLDAGIAKWCHLIHRESEKDSESNRAQQHLVTVPSSTAC